MVFTSVRENLEVVRVPVFPVSVISAPGTLPNGEDSALSGPCNLGIGGDSIISARSTLGTSEDSSHFSS